ncbi:MAG TPA: SCO family protein [Flavisolibacter sp.]|jgi:protein SCO1/2|nr:SCO family protein [Flavisolibacter sp.]
MNKKAFYGLLLGLFVPVAAYMVMRFIPPANVMPYRLFYEDVATTVKNGKEVKDTIWSKVPDFTLTNQLGQKVSYSDLKGKIVVADFFFTRCPVVCPKMTQNMKRLQEAVKNNNRAGSREPDFIHFLSISVDPEHDSVQQLKRYADRFNINPQNWWLLTGDKKEIYDLALQGMKLGINDTEVDTAFIHPQKLILIDKEGVIRARKDEFGNPKLYDGLDSNDVKNIAEDIILLTVEKDKKRKFFLADKLPIIGIVLVVTAIGVVLLMFVLRKKKNV